MSADIPPTQKFISALAGATLTSLLTTPLDVVKTRLQAQPTPAAVQAPTLTPAAKEYVDTVIRWCGRSTLGSAASITASTSQTTWGGMFSSCGKPVSSMFMQQLARPHGGYAVCTCVDGFSTHAVSGSGCLVARQRIPLPPSATALPARPPALMYSGTVDAMRSIARTEGITSLWRGLSPTLAMSVPSTVIYFVGYDYIRDIIGSAIGEQPVRQQTASGSGSSFAIAPLLAGAAARTAAVTVVSPLELIRTRMQAAAAHDLRAVVAGIAKMVKNDGFGSLWRGLAPSLWRDVPFSAIYWTGYETIRSSLSSRMRAQNAAASGGHVTELSGRQEYSVAFISGASSGIIAAIATNPFDVAKTRRQIDLSRARTLGYVSPAAAGTLPLMQHMIATEGWMSLYRGIAPRLIKIAPACAIMISTYEAGKYYFGHNKQQQQ
ncbi:mitochondrial carrier [Ramicandelaber brevisporus]|nr:mitochondrial carrier [Ramicandelaber brevisporus]